MTPWMETDGFADSFADAADIAVNGPEVSGQLPGFDGDYYQFTAPAHQEIMIETGGPLDTWLSVYAGDAEDFDWYDDSSWPIPLYDDSDSGPGWLSRIIFTSPLEAMYFVFVESFSMIEPGEDAPYTLRITSREAPEITLFLNAVENSTRIARAVVSSGTVYELWTTQDPAAYAAFLSDIDIALEDGSKLYVQLDSEGRLSFLRAPNGYSLRIHRYFSEGIADATFVDPYDIGQRGLVDYTLFTTAPNASYYDNDEHMVMKRPDAGPVQHGVKSQASGQCGILARTLHGTALDTQAETAVAFLSCLDGMDFNGMDFTVIVDTAIACMEDQEVPDAVRYALLQDAAGIGEAAHLCKYDILQLGLEAAPETRPETGGVTIRKGSVEVTLVWDKASDLDLIVTEPSGEEISRTHPTSVTQGELGQDNTFGFGPESVVWAGEPPPQGAYQVEVEYFSERGLGPVRYEVTAHYPSAGEEVFEVFIGVLTARGERHTVTTFIVD